RLRVRGACGYRRAGHRPRPAVAVSLGEVPRAGDPRDWPRAGGVAECDRLAHRYPRIDPGADDNRERERRMKELFLRVLPKANDDGEFSVAARMWDSELVLASGIDAVRMTMRDGRVT